MRTRSMSVTQIVIVHFGEIPLAKLAHDPNLASFLELYSFQGREVRRGPSNKISSIFCHNGIFGHGDQDYVVERVELEERRILFKVEGSSQEADAFYESLVSFLSSLSGAADEEYLHPLVKSEESEIVSYLDFSIEGLIAPAFLRFITSAATEMAGSEIASAHVKPGGLTFHVDFVLKDGRLEDQRITLSRKEIRLEPRKGHSLADQVYYSKAPFDTDTHIRLLEMLEKEMAQATE